MSGNYTEEFPLLKKLLRTEAFRFIIVRYNHYSLVEQLEADLRAAYPDRPVVWDNAEKTNFKTLIDSFLELQNGFFFVKNFGLLAKDETTSLGEITADMQTENERRQAITAGLNLRRDKLAKTNNALIILVMATPDELIVRSLRKKMPDLWSFRSLFLDLEMDLKTEIVDTRPVDISDRLLTEERVIEPSEFEKNKKEIRRLQRSLTKAKEEDLSLKLSIYPQLTRLLVENGVYDKAVLFYDEWLESVEHEEDRLDILFDKGDALVEKGQLMPALEAFEKTLVLAEKYELKNKVGLCHERMGDIRKDLGHLDKALDHFQVYHQIEKELLKQFSDDLTYKNNLAISYLKLGETNNMLGNVEKALQYFEDGTNLFEELYDSYPQNVSFKYDLASSHLKRGGTHSALGNLEKALHYFEDGANLFEELYGSHPQNVGFKNGLAISSLKLGETHSALGNLEKALQYFEDGANLFEELYGSHPQNVSFKKGLAISCQNLANIFSKKGEIEKALSLYKKMNGLAHELFESYPQNVDFKNGLAHSYSNIGNFYRDHANDTQKAKEYFQQCYNLWQELVTAYPDYAEFQNNFDWAKKALEEL